MHDCEISLAYIFPDLREPRDSKAFNLLECWKKSHIEIWNDIFAQFDFILRQMECVKGRLHNSDKYVSWYVGAIIYQDINLFQCQWRNLYQQDKKYTRVVFGMIQS